MPYFCNTCPQPLYGCPNRGSFCFYTNLRPRIVIKSIYNLYQYLNNMDFDWKDIYQDFLNSKNRKFSEREFQNCIFSVFRYYLRWQNCIVAEESIRIGSANTIRPDFVLYKDDMPQVVIESKEPNHIQTQRNKEQLFSYMRQKKVDFGLYIGEVIQLYYDVPTDAELPLLCLPWNTIKEINMAQRLSTFSTMLILTRTNWLTIALKEYMKSKRNSKWNLIFSS